jgi:hypothetical protein
MVDETQRSSSSIDRKSLENKTKPDNLVLNKISKEFKTKEKKTKNKKNKNNKNNKKNPKKT